MKYNFLEQLNKDESNYQLGQRSGFFKIEEGDNKIRILSPSISIAQHFQGKKERPAICGGDNCSFNHKESPPQIKWLVYLWDYKDNKVKLARLPYTVIKAIAGFQQNPEYAFEDVPMPYDVTIQAKGAGTKEVAYTIIPARQNSPVSEEALNDLAGRKNILEVVDSMKNKAAKETQNDKLNEELQEVAEIDVETMF